MYIKTSFIECGEWGGHLEEIKIYFSDRICYASYEKYSADCNSVKINNERPIQTLVSKFVRRFGNFEQLLLRAYIHSLIDLKFSESDFGHSYMISEVKFRSQINLFVTSWSTEVATNYNKLKSALAN